MYSHAVKLFLCNAGENAYNLFKGHREVLNLSLDPEVCLLYLNQNCKKWLHFFSN